MNKITIAIDGHSSCGKSTMAKDLAKEIGYVYIDTGAMYRVVTLYALNNGMITEVDGQKIVAEDTLQADIDAGKIVVSFKLNPETNLPLACLNGEVVEDEIRTMRVSDNVSPVSALPFVRSFLTSQQKAMGKKKGIVMDGRDIGTAVFPKAELKIFLTATPEVRAQRRYDELLRKGEKGVKFEDVLKNVQERDYIDTHREVAPLRQAEDAIVIDNSNLTKDEQNALLLEYFNKVESRENHADGD